MEPVQAFTSEARHLEEGTWTSSWLGSPWSNYWLASTIALLLYDHGIIATYSYNDKDLTKSPSYMPR